MKIAIGSDHAGFLYKEAVREFLVEEGHDVKDFGTYSTDSCDYPDFIRPVAKAVAAGEFERGIVLGGSGNGEAMVANKVKGVRCAFVLGFALGKVKQAAQRRERAFARREDDGDFRGDGDCRALA